MIEFIDSADDVIALKVSGKLMRDELEEVTARLERSFADHAKTHVYVEIEDYRGFELAALPDYLPHAFAMMKRLDRFGRVAVVSDQSWIRWATRLESALLPHISYEVFEGAERHRALAWVEGKLNPLHDPSIRIIETDRPGTFGLELNGRIGAADARAAADYFNEAMEGTQKLRLLARVKNVDGAELGALFGHEFLEARIGMLKRLERYAVVGGPVWLCAWIAAVGPLVGVELRHFPAEEEAAAWAWLEAHPKAERALAA
jgi:hypothetical protein